MERKVCLVTGATSGIGKSTLFKFASEGYDVALNYIKSDDEALKIKKEIEDKYDTRVLLCKADVSNESDVKNMADSIIENFGKIDCVVNNAGICNDNAFEEKSVEDFKRIIDVNLIGTFIVSKYTYKYLKESNGTIVNVSSTNGIDTNYPESMDYDASKAGVISLTKNLAIEFAPDIRVNCVAPGWTKTRMTNDIDLEYKRLEERKILLNRFADPEEIANVVYFLSSNEASYINGEIIRVDGGYKA